MYFHNSFSLYTNLLSILSSIIIIVLIIIYPKKKSYITEIVFFLCISDIMN